jgi:hypothetical protein
MKKFGILLIIICALIIIFLYLGKVTGTISPAEETHAFMRKTAFRIELYRKDNGKLPDNLAQLPRKEGSLNSIVDGWGKQFEYKVKDANTVVLQSYGEDGKAGGVHSAADIVKEFKIEN